MLALTWYDFMEAVTVAEVVVALKPLRPLTQRPTRHVRLEVLHQSLLKMSDGPLVVAFLVQPHGCGEGALRWRRERGSYERETAGWALITFGIFI